MKRVTICAALLLALSLAAAPQFVGQETAAQSAGEQITVTLVRWPYT